MPQGSGRVRPATASGALRQALGQHVVLRLNAARTLAGRLDSVDELGNCIVTIQEGGTPRPCVVRGQAVMDVVVVASQQSAAGEEGATAPRSPQAPAETA